MFDYKEITKVRKKNYPDKNPTYLSVLQLVLQRDRLIPWLFHLG